MTDAERQLVQTIAREVLAVLRAREGEDRQSPEARQGERGQRAEVRPPIGICTGDYSKFPELAGRLYGAGAVGGRTFGEPPRDAAGGRADAGSGRQGGDGSEVQSAPADARQESDAQRAERRPEPQPEPLALTGIITAAQLQAALEDSPDGVALAPDARLTPLANDLARQASDRIRRQNDARRNSPGASMSGDPVAAAALPWLWWIDGSCPAVQELTAQRRGRLRPSTGGGGGDGLGRVVRALAAAIKARQVAGGLLFVRSAARPIVLANRCASLRAVVATCGEAVEEGVGEIGANVLIVEYPHHGLRSMSAMVDRMLQQPPRVAPATERELADLQRCG